MQFQVANFTQFLSNYSKNGLQKHVLKNKQKEYIQKYT